MPLSSAAWIAAMDSSSSCAPQPNCHSEPPMAHAPTPIGVISRSLAPSLRFCMPLYCQLLRDCQLLRSCPLHSSAAGVFLVVFAPPLDNPQQDAAERCNVGGFLDEFAGAQRQ